MATADTIFAAPASPARRKHRHAAGVPRVHRGGAPEQFEGLADLVVRDRCEWSARAEPFDSPADPDPLRCDHVRVTERSRKTSAAVRTVSVFAVGSQGPLRAVTRGTSSQVTDQATADIGVLSAGRLQIAFATAASSVATRCDEGRAHDLTWMFLSPVIRGHAEVGAEIGALQRGPCPARVGGAGTASDGTGCWTGVTSG